MDQFCSWKPSDLLAKYQENKTEISIQKYLFPHVTNYVAQKHWDIGHDNVTPSGYLNIEMSDKQRTLLNPTQMMFWLVFLLMTQKGREKSRK